jgi:glycosyltransferase involved in cell wall biosynthesis
MPILEAQATGLPVVTSNCSSMPEVAGGGAMLVDPLDVASIRKGIETLVQQPQARAKVVEKGYANVGRFSRAVVASEYCRLYAELGN